MEQHDAAQYYAHLLVQQEHVFMLKEASIGLALATAAVFVPIGEVDAVTGQRRKSRSS